MHKETKANKHIGKEDKEAQQIVAPQEVEDAKSHEVPASIDL